MAAALLAMPEIALSDDEAHRLSRALAAVSKHYGSRIPTIKPHHLALATLVWTAGTIYIPKALAIKARAGRPPPDPAPFQAAAERSMAPAAPAPAQAGGWNLGLPAGNA